ncbi:MAG TPA: hypothetical protein VGS41_06910 [Chthonomonadales bacterium]|nr:hypothetical protein [Chthonomonadales bacterium]
MSCKKPFAIACAVGVAALAVAIAAASPRHAVAGHRGERMLAHGRQNPYGGTGHIRVSQSNGKVYILYRIVSGGGTGSAPVTCFVRQPGAAGQATEYFALANGVPWSGGSLSHQFVYPDDFGGNAGFPTSGTYTVAAYWGPNSGYGFNQSYVDGAFNAFTR